MYLHRWPSEHFGCCIKHISSASGEHSVSRHRRCDSRFAHPEILHVSCVCGPVRSQMTITEWVQTTRQMLGPPAVGRYIIIESPGRRIATPTSIRVGFGCRHHVYTVGAQKLPIHRCWSCADGECIYIGGPVSISGVASNTYRVPRVSTA